MAHLPKGQGVFLPPFKAWLASNIPAVYDNTMTYYEELCALIKYLQDVVIPALNHNAEAVTTIATAVEQLQKYVEDYFKNLDVQEEINNKLDDMAENGTLQEIITAYIQSSVAWTFDTVADMQSATNLIDGSYAQTLGYHAINDGGNAIYKIQSTEPDSGHYETVGNLYAVLVYNNHINVKQFGAYGDGTHDDTNAIKSAVSYLSSLYSTSTIFTNQLTLTLTHGSYLVSETISIPVVVKLNIEGNVLIKSNVGDGSTLWINSGNIQKEDAGSNIINQQSYNVGYEIGGNGTLCIERNTVDPEADVNDLTKHSIGLEIGDRSYNALYINVARNSYKNIAISGFSTGIQLNSINTYLIRFEKCKIERNRVDFAYGTSDGTRYNSGENITFDGCALAGSYNAFVTYKDGNFNIVDSSFDFNGNDILLNSISHIVLTNPHIEGVGFNQAGIIEASDDNCTGFGTIVYQNYTPANQSEVATVEINNPDYYLGSSSNKLIPRFQSNFNGAFKGLHIILNQHQAYNEAGYTFDNAYLNTPNVKIYNFSTTYSNSTVPVIPFNDSDETGKLTILPTITALDSLNNNYMYSTQQISGVSTDTSDKIFDKSLVFTMSNTSWFTIRRDLSYSQSGKIGITAYLKPNLTGDSDTWDHLGVVVRAYFRNKNNINVGNPVELYLNSQAHLLEKDDWILVKPCVIQVPEGCETIGIALSLTNKNSSDTNIASSGSIKFGGLIVQPM